MTKRKKPETYVELVDRLTGEAISDLGRGYSIRNIINNTVIHTALWQKDWSEYENAK